MSETPTSIEPAAPAPLDELELQRFIDARLDEASQAALQARLKADPAARRSLDALREEDALMRGALETLSEPQGKLGEKILATLYDEQRQRMRLERARVFRRRLVWSVASAAAVMLALLLIKPREEAGAVVAGSGVGLLQKDGSVAALERTQRFYEGDTLVTAHGQFARIRLSDGSQVDLDEDSRLKIEQTAHRSPMLALEAGRMGLQAGPHSLGVLVRPGVDAAETLSAEAGVAFDLWLAAPTDARWPDWAEAWSRAEPAPDASPRRVCVSVAEGTVYVNGGGNLRPVALGAQHRIVFGAGLPPQSGFEIDALHALDPRREGWAGMDGAGPQDRLMVGLLESWDPVELGERLGLAKDVPGGSEAIGAALGQMREGLRATDAAERARLLGAGQQSLREATQGLLLRDERRYLERVVEGLAHFERARSLRALQTPQAKADARNAYLAAAVAFHEALNGAEPEVGAEQAEPLGQRPAPELHANLRLSDLAPPAQGKLLASFYQPWALLGLAQSQGSAGGDEVPPEIAGLNAADSFEHARTLLTPCVESLAAQYGLALALGSSGQAEEAAAEFEKLASVSVAGLSAGSKRQVEGLRQASHVALIRLHAQSRNGVQLENWLDTFRVRYPLDADGRAGRAIREVLSEALLQGAERALRAKDYTQALDCFHDLLAQPGLDESLDDAARFGIKCGQLEAYLGVEDGRRAARAARELERLLPDGLSAERRADLLGQMDRAKALFERQRQDRGATEASAPESIQLDLNE
ncbi:MAG: FecR domain-containing protein [Planctomycetes bacterium]|nr:FecR domain-containing protein [Planctomycetota bacterium]